MTDWKSCLENPRGRFTFDWFQEHVATKELLKSGPFFGNVLDVGCGIGGRTYIVAESYPAALVCGIDVSNTGIEHARRHFNLANTRYFVDDATRMHYDDDEFDFVFSLGVIEHIPDTASFLGEINRVLKPGGQLFLAVTEKNYHADPGHVHMYSKNMVLVLLLDEFDIEDGYVKEHIIFVRARKK